MCKNYGEFHTLVFDPGWLPESVNQFDRQAPKTVMACL
jgi:hypothetical protein